MAQYFHQMRPADGQRVGGQSPSTKVVKVRNAQGTVLLSMRDLWKKRKLLKRGANAARAGNQRGQRVRSWIASQRGYFRGNTGPRGSGRETGTGNPLASASRADLAKVSAPGRMTKIGWYLPKAGG